MGGENLVVGCDGTFLSGSQVRGSDKSRIVREIGTGEVGIYGHDVVLQPGDKMARRDIEYAAVTDVYKRRLFQQNDVLFVPLCEYE